MSSPSSASLAGFALTTPTKSWDRMNENLMAAVMLPIQGQKTRHPHLEGIRARIPPIFHDGKSDLDPTEWKPSEQGNDHNAHPTPKARPDIAHPVTDSAIVDGEPDTASRISAHGPTAEDFCSINSSANSLASAPASTSSMAARGSWKPKMTHRPSSEAFNYLSQFHHPSSSSLTRTRKPRERENPHTIARATLPGLSYTPNTVHSSANSSAVSISISDADAQTPIGSEQRSRTSSDGASDNDDKPLTMALKKKQSYELVTRPSVISLPTTAISTGDALFIDEAAVAEGNEEGKMTMKTAQGDGMSDMTTSAVPRARSGHGKGHGHGVCGCCGLTKGAEGVEPASAKGSLKKLLSG